MSNTYVIINDEIIPSENASLLISDLSIQRAYGIFDFFKTVNGKPIFLDDHLDRFYHSASQMRLPVEKNREQLKLLLNELMEKNTMPNSGIRITLTGGYSHDGYSIAKPNLLITQQLYSVNEGAKLKGIQLVTYSHQRQLPQVKTLDYLTAILLQPFIKENNADDVLYQHGSLVSECPRANFFIVSGDGKLITAAGNILKGVIRKHVLRLSKYHSIITEERDLSLEEVYKAKEAFITSTTKNILPVVQIDGHLIGNGKPGAISQFLDSELERLIY